MWIKKKAAFELDLKHDKAGSASFIFIFIVKNQRLCLLNTVVSPEKIQTKI